MLNLNDDDIKMLDNNGISKEWIKDLDEILRKELRHSKYSALIKDSIVRDIIFDGVTRHYKGRKLKSFIIDELSSHIDAYL